MSSRLKPPSETKKTTAYLVCRNGNPIATASDLDTAVLVASEKLRAMAISGTYDLAVGIGVSPIEHYAPRTLMSALEEVLPSGRALADVDASSFRRDLVGPLDTAPASPLQPEDSTWPEPTS